MVEDVKERRSESECGGKHHAMRLERECEAEANENDADILYRVVGEKPLEIVLHQRIQHTHHRRDAGEREDDDAPPPGWRTGKLEGDAHETVDGDFGHDAAHQRRDMARRRWVCERQPDMQRYDAGFGSGADKREYEH